MVYIQSCISSATLISLKNNKKEENKKEVNKIENNKYNHKLSRFSEYT